MIESRLIHNRITLYQVHRYFGVPGSDCRTVVSACRVPRMYKEIRRICVDFEESEGERLPGGASDT